jgi:hypothetical protein
VITPEEALAAGLKLAAALPVLRWPLAGALVAIAADALDVVVMNYVDLGGGGIRNYHAFDKWTDLFALATFLAVALRWTGRARAIALALFALRLLGVALFETTAWRGALILLPNLFETWFLFVCLRTAWFPGAAGAGPRVLLGAMGASKLVQEWLLHGVQLMDRYNLQDVVDGLFR